MTQTELANLIDHTLLKPDATQEQILQLCNEARRYSFRTVCVAPLWVPVALAALEGSKPSVAAVIGFPHGNTLPEVKAFEARRAVELGASELDMVINIGALKDQDYRRVEDDIAGVVNAARLRHPTLVKVIIETSVLTQREKSTACEIAECAGANFVKTSTGFGSGGAKVEDVRLMRDVVGDRLGIKASGGIRDLATAFSMIDAGATRLGCTASVAIIEEMENGRTLPLQIV